MTQQDEVREQVRARYAAAATAVTGRGLDALTVLDGDTCCGPTEHGGRCSGRNGRGRGLRLRRSTAPPSKASCRPRRLRPVSAAATR